MLAEIPFRVYIAVILVIDVLATIWYRSSVRRGKEENASITFEKVTYVSALFLSAVGIAALLIFLVVFRL